MIDPHTLPYRPNVGAVLFDRAGRVFVARRADLPNAEGAPGGWQLPQGGIDQNEDPRAAVLRTKPDFRGRFDIGRGVGRARAVRASAGAMAGLGAGVRMAPRT